MTHWHNGFMIFRQRLPGIHGYKYFQFAMEVIERLQRRGFQTVFAGGCVRDGLLGVKPKDLDIATAAPPEVVEAEFPRTLAVGKAFGTIIVVGDDCHFEVTTFRTEGPYRDGRHPETVAFSGIEEDARRRDFTVNALFYDPLREEVLDFVGGMEDLNMSLLRTVGLPQERFGEDHLRMLRAVRFVGQLGFRLDPPALHAVQLAYHDLSKVSAERIFNEVRRLLSSRYLKRGLECLLESRLYRVFWSELENFDPVSLERYPVFTGWENAYAAIMTVVGAAPEFRLRSWKVPRESLRRVHEQMEGARRLLDPQGTRAKRAHILARDTVLEILVLATGMSQDPGLIEVYIREYLSITGPSGTLPEPLVTGQDLLQMGIAPGKEMGKILRVLFDAQLEGRLRSKLEALKYVKERFF
jgi:poly(A) polymerase